ncbi:MAG: hypothetical protein QM674_14920 [Burkholderiaceae bacterium]
MPAHRRARGWRVVALALASVLLGSCATPGAMPGKTPIAYRAINLDGRCAQTEDDGFRENATLKVADNVVQSLQWQLSVGKRGGCRFDGADFRQVQTRPHIELRARDGGGCKLMIWRDDRRITLAHAGCESRCTGNVYDQAWPVMFDPSSGACASAR